MERFVFKVEAELQQSLKLGRIPVMWKKSCIVPVPQEAHPIWLQRLLTGCADVTRHEGP